LGPAGREPWGGVPGPADRETFFAAQRRHRRATWRYSATCAVAAFVLAMAASIVLSPLVILSSALVIRVLSLFLPIPEIVWDVFRWLLAHYGQLKSALQDLRLSPEEVIPSLQGLGVLSIPGIVIVLLLWLAVRALLFHAGVGGLLLTMGARLPRANDREEHQLVNVVQEMAIAVGLPSPTVMLVDADVANAAAIGSSPRDATVVVSRRLLDELDRDETQGILGHLIASIGNGDLRILMTFLSVAQTFGLLMALLDAPMSARARATIWRLLTLALFGWRRRTAAGPLADIVGTMLVGRLDPDAIDDTLEPLDATDRPSTGRLHRMLRYLQFVLLLPVILLSLEGKLLLFLFTLLVIGPLTWSTLRRRRYLADATAVQLTRNPDGLADGLIALAESGGDAPGGRWAGPLFVVGGARSRATGLGFVSGRPRRRLPSPSTPPAHHDDVPIFLLGAQPPLRGRLARLRVLGASIQPPTTGRTDAGPAIPTEASATGSSSSVLGWFLAVPVIGVLVLIVGALIFYGASFILYLFAVGFLGALFVIAGLYIVAMELVLRLLSFAG